MFKSYSKIVGLTYLWNTLARPLAEMDHNARKQDKKEMLEGGSLMAIQMEVDTNKMEEGADANIGRYQVPLFAEPKLSATATLILNNILSSEDTFPAEFAQILRTIYLDVSLKFPGQGTCTS